MIIKKDSYYYVFHSHIKDTTDEIKDIIIDEGLDYETVRDEIHEVKGEEILNIPPETYENEFWIDLIEKYRKEETNE